MGEGSDGDEAGKHARRRSHWAPIRDVDPDAEKNLSARYDLPLDSGLFELAETLRSYATRDLIPGWNSEKFKKRRAEARRSVIAIIEDATRIQANIVRLRTKLERFEAEFEYNPPLMESVFDADFGPPTELFVPEEIQPLASLFRAMEPWDTIRDRLQAIIALPVRKERTHGRIPHVTLKKAVAACRQYWRDQGRSWKMEMLDTGLADDELSLLEGECERFVADTLRATGFEFTLSELARAWRDRPSSKATNQP